jgi:ElaB/YqjD/DUF883 family membrane-anchored ribosome-binding protein
MEDFMAEDTVLSQELRAIKEELAALQKKRSLRSEGAAAEAKHSRDDHPGEGAGEQHLADDLVKMITEFLEKAEQSISERPAASVIAALVAGIFIGRLLGRR